MVANRTVICPACGFTRRVACSPVVPARYGTSKWPYHCEAAMLVVGYRQSQAVTQLTPGERVIWVSLGGPIKKGRGKKRWVPIMTEARLDDRYPLS
jgi:hypothetical protein